LAKRGWAISFRTLVRVSLSFCFFDFKCFIVGIVAPTRKRLQFHSGHYRFCCSIPWVAPSVAGSATPPPSHRP
jgi:hypothetical protein